MSITSTIKKALPFKLTTRTPKPTYQKTQYSWLYPYLLKGYDGDRAKNAKITWNTYYQAMDNDVVSACIDAYIVETLAAGFNISSDNVEQDNPDVINYITDLFQRPDGPDGRDSYTKFMMRGLASYLGPGDWFAEVVYDETVTGIPTGLYYIQPHRMTYHYDTDQWGLVGTDIRYENDQLIHVMNPDMNNELWGKSLIDKAAKAMTLDILGMDYNKDWFTDGISPKNFFEFDAGITPDTFEKAVDSIIEQKKTNPRGTYMLHGGKFKDGGSTNKEMDFVALLRLMRDRIIMTWQVPPKLIGIKDTGQLGGKGDSEEDMKLFKKRITGKIFNVVEDEFNRVLGKSFDLWGWEERFHFGDIDIEDKQQRATIENIRLRNGSSYVNEVRAKYGEDPVDWGDVPLSYAVGSNGYAPSVSSDGKSVGRNLDVVSKMLCDAGFMKSM